MKKRATKITKLYHITNIKVLEHNPLAKRL